MNGAAQAKARGSGGLVVLTALAAPVALAFETLLRHLLFPPSFEVLRETLRPVLTPVAWGLAGACLLAGIAGLFLQRRMATRAVARLAADRRSGGEAARARLGAFLLAASVAQVPAILATFSYMFGARITPVLVAVALVTLAVLAQAQLARRDG